MNLRIFEVRVRRQRFGNFESFGRRSSLQLVAHHAHRVVAHGDRILQDGAVDFAALEAFGDIFASVETDEFDFAGQFGATQSREHARGGGLVKKFALQTRLSCDEKGTESAAWRVDWRG